MWSQYSENHRGFCLIFSKQKLYADLEEYVDKSECYFSPVVYRIEQRINQKVKTIDVNQMSKLGIEEYAYYHVRIHHNALFFQRTKITKMNVNIE
jgi:hypothetical protein